MPFLRQSVYRLCCLLAGMVPLLSLNAAEPLESFAAVRALSQDQAAESVNIRVEATVLGVDPGSPWSLFMHDGTAGCYVKLVPGTNLPAFAPGQRLRVEGVSMKLGYYPNVGRARVLELGHGPLPAPVRLSPDQIFSPAFDSAWVDVPAVVVGYGSKDERFTLDVKVFGLPFKAELPLEPGVDIKAASLLQRPVRMRGVLGTIFNQHRQMTDRHFFVPSIRDVVPTVAPVNGDLAPRIEVTQILTGVYGPDTLIRIKGVVTQAADNGFHLRDASGSTLVRAVSGERYAPGDLVEVEGFGDIAPFRPVVRATTVAKLGRAARPDPVPLDCNSPELPQMHAELVTLEAEFVGQREGRFERILQCQSENQVFEVLLRGGTERGPELQVGDRLAVTGICELTTTHALPRIGWVDGFRVHLAGVEGLRVTTPAPWWTPRRLVFALALMSAIALLGLVGTWMFRRQVQRQMAVISETLRAEAIGKERDRMARDLHDTLEQQLSGVALQLDGLDDAIRARPESALRSLSMARRMLRFTRVEARRSVWDLRSKTLEKEGLAAALREMAATATGPTGPAIEVKVLGTDADIPAPVQFHLLRIAQEALANAIKHSDARQILIELERNPGLTRLAVSDDGKGFDPGAADLAPGPHFGTLGMRERAAKLDGVLSIETTPGRGCVVSVGVPTKPSGAAS